MKRTAFFLTGMAALVASSLFAGPAGAQAPGGNQQAYTQAAAAPQSKVVVINLQRVVKSYKKWAAFEEQYKQTYKQFDAELNKRKERGLALKNDLAKQTAPEGTEQIQAQLRALDREVQDIGEEARKRLSKMSDEMAVVIYKEINDAVARYAAAYNIEMVMHFNDAITPADVFNPANVQRKLQTGACMPMYVAHGLDITDQIAANLNFAYDQAVRQQGQLQQTQGRQP